MRSGRASSRALVLYSELAAELVRGAAAEEESWKESQLPARQLGLQIQSIEVSSADEFENAFNEASKSGSGALAVTLFSSHPKRIVSLATKRRIPAIYTRGKFVENRGLLSYGADQDPSVKRIAMMIDKILKGAKPADLPVEQPQRSLGL